MSESPLEETSNRTKVAVGVVLLVGLLYSVLILGQIAAFVGPLLTAVVLWLLYRFVVAHERIADAQERRTRAVERRADVVEAATGGATNATETDESAD